MGLDTRLVWRWMAFVPCVAVAAFACSEETAPAGDDGGAILTGAGGAAVTSTSSTGTTSATTGATVSASVTGTSTGTGGATTATASSSGSGPSCNDVGVGEPNQSESTAHVLKMPSLPDCDSDGGKVAGKLSKGDVDWFTYTGDDSFSCSVDPGRTLSPTGKGMRLCKYVECTTGETKFTCPAGTQPDTSPENRAGCCGTSGVLFDDLDCVGSLDEHAYVYIRVDLPGADDATCQAYELSYHY